MNVWDAIQQKRAVRHFKDEPLPDDAILRILKAGRRSQSSKNTQPWHFLVLRSRETLNRLAELGTYLDPVRRANTVIAIVTQNVDAAHSNWIAFDVGQAAAYMQLAATELGIGSVIGTIHQWEKAPEVLGLPEGIRCDVVLSFGYPAETEVQKSRNPQGRRPLEDMVHWETW